MNIGIWDPPIFVTNSMEHSHSSEANNPSASQEIPPPPPFMEPKFHHRVHKSPPLTPYPEPNESSPQHPTLFP
jgi:hypothetical protein